MNKIKYLFCVSLALYVFVGFSDNEKCNPNLFKKNHLTKKLHKAISKDKSLNEIGYLIDRGADPNAIRSPNFLIKWILALRKTAISIASEKRDFEILNLLIDKGADLNTTIFTPQGEKIGALHIASEQGDLPMVKFLIKNGVNVNNKTFRHKENFIYFSVEKSRTAMHFASKNGHVEVVKFLVEQGAKVDAKTSNNDTPLHKASMMGELRIVRFLVEQGAKVDAINIYKDTPLSVASRFGHKAVVKFLVEQGADPSFKRKKQPEDKPHEFDWFRGA
ncbi:MAG: ankyrin repeat domain-containing protein [Bdellovibrionales bacterium]